MKAFGLFCLLMLASTISAHARAQVAGCAPGDISSTSGGVSTCLPGNESGPSPAPLQGASAVWEKRWGAIATDEPHGIIGASAGEKTSSAAEKNAIADCKSKGGAKCTLQASYANACGAVLVGDKTFNVNWGDSAEAAADKGLKVCSSADTGCHVYFTTCSGPVRIR